MNMLAAEAPVEMSIPPWMIDKIMRIVTAGIVSNPSTIRVNMRGIGMAF
jgi:hypothetical protein